MFTILSSTLLVRLMNFSSPFLSSSSSWKTVLKILGLSGGRQTLLQLEDR